MRIQINSKRKFFCSIFVVAICATFVALGSWSFAESELEKTVTEAYELRMNGKADEAEAKLEQLLAENPNNAPAHYEFARTKFQLGLSNLRELVSSIEEAQNSIEQAIKNDPENVIYYFFAGRIAFMTAYMGMQRDQSDAKEKVAKLCGHYESTLKLKPDYHEAILCLVQIYGILPENMGGDKSKSEQHTKKLEEMDEIFGAKARAILMPEETNFVEYWQKVSDKHKGNAEVLRELGRANLFKDQVEEGVRCFEEAIGIDPNQTILILDLARYHAYKVLRDKKLKDTELPLAEKAFVKYLDSDPIPPLKAFATYLLARIKSAMDNKKEADELFQKAKTIDPYHSMASGVPTLDLWVPPGEISHNNRYLFFPF
jgi:tetratricopeptide (TPR) repeat protein